MKQDPQNPRWTIPPQVPTIAAALTALFLLSVGTSSYRRYETRSKWFGFSSETTDAGTDWVPVLLLMGGGSTAIYFAAKGLRKVIEGANSEPTQVAPIPETQARQEEPEPAVPAPPAETPKANTADELALLVAGTESIEFVITGRLTADSARSGGYRGMMSQSSKGLPWIGIAFVGIAFFVTLILAWPAGNVSTAYQAAAVIAVITALLLRAVRWGFFALLGVQPTTATLDDAVLFGSEHVWVLQGVTKNRQSGEVTCADVSRYARSTVTLGKPSALQAPAFRDCIQITVKKPKAWFAEAGFRLVQPRNHDHTRGFVRGVVTISEALAQAQRVSPP